MSNFAIDININAPELVGIIKHLCIALDKAAIKPTSTEVKPEPVPQPVQTATVTPAPAQPIPQQAPVQAAPAAAPTTKTYTMDEIAKAAADFMSPATIPQLQALLASFGVNGLPDLPADKLGAFAAELRKMGAKI